MTDHRSTTRRGPTKRLGSALLPARSPRAASAARAAKSASAARAAKAATGVTAAVAVLAIGSLAACSLNNTPPTSNASTTPGATTPNQTDTTLVPPQGPCPKGAVVTVATHDSFSIPEAALAKFTQDTGCAVKILKNGDAGQLTNKLVLTKSSPIADVVFGIDNTYAGRAVKEGILTAYASRALPSGAADHAAAGAGAAVLTPIDFGDVCVNVDDTWFAAAQIQPPKTLDDLADPAFKELFVTPSPATSSPGMAFFLATVGKYGPDGWQAYWTKLKANGVKVTSGWSDAYEVDFTQGGGKGTRPIVLSYASSPPFTVPKGQSTPTTSALLDTCFRQTEYAGVLAGAKQQVGAKAFVDFLLSPAVQASIPESMYMFPVANQVALPADWAKWAKVAPKPLDVAPEVIDANREAWLRQWTDLIGQ